MSMFETYICNEDGFAAWRRGTGDNVEITWFRAAEERKGCGRRLLIAMLEQLKVRPPYATVFGFTRASNSAAQKFYQSMGFTLSFVEGVYSDGAAVVFSAPYPTLCEMHLHGRDDTGQPVHGR